MQLVSLDSRNLELLEQLQDFMNGYLLGRMVVNPLEVSVRLILHLPGHRASHFWENAGQVSSPDLLYGVGGEGWSGGWWSWVGWEQARK